MIDIKTLKKTIRGKKVLIDSNIIVIAMAVKKYLVNFPNSNCQPVTFFLSKPQLLEL